jgi:hypothetical protein
MLKQWATTVLLMLGFGAAGAFTLLYAAEAKFLDSFNVDKTSLTDKGSNNCMILQPGYKLVLADGNDSLLITVLDETKMVDGVKNRIVEERETKGGKLEELSRNYYAIDKLTGDVYYFGEDVDVFDTSGKVISHEGSWHSGVNGARFGLMMPGKPQVGNRYYQEVAPNLAMDRAEVVSLDETVKVPLGTFNNCLKTKESSGLESGVEQKLYAPWVGLLKDGDFELAKIEVPLSRSALPAPVAKTFQTTFPNAQVTKLDVDVEDGIAIYDFEFNDGAAEKETDIAADGTMLEFTIVVKAEDVPPAAVKTISRTTEGAEIKRIEYIVIGYKMENGKPVKLPESVIHYAIEMTKAGRTTEFVITPDGAFVRE